MLESALYLVSWHFVCSCVHVLGLLVGLHYCGWVLSKEGAEWNGREGER